MLRSRLRSKALVEDAIQETFTRVLTNSQSGGLQSPERLGAFVNSVCNNVLFEAYRAGSRTTPLDEEYDQADNRAASAEARIVQGRGFTRAFARRWRHCRSGNGTCSNGCSFEDRDKDEVCGRLDVDRNYLRVLLHRAKMRFGNSC